VSRSDPERLRDILECIEAIDRAEVTVARYPGDPDVARIALDAVQSRVFTIGEAVKGLSLGLRQRYPDVPWSDMARMRDLIGHHYPRSFALPSVRPSNGFGPRAKRSLPNPSGRLRITSRQSSKLQATRALGL